ncbi:putative acetyltransferase [Actinacidiphila reveromycinica]|uniref:Putative acetyltransferase n=1 Tax=Actinacidiphila reveromycinica TaxID=659352 RepID=A0A7U3V0K4_9ACTN|nr:GNAT family N-acetyltransferase [Streptomyces sp. SN-593]BBB02082.1 putative acetyltransferase [Streptomyces sp. SN-593]
MDVALRAVQDGDLPVFFVQTADPEAVWMAAFTSEDPAVVGRTVVGAGGDVLGHVAVFGPPEEREVTYWIGREHWGQGVATAALRALLTEVPERPLHARAAIDNAGSIRVLEKCGFAVAGTERGYAHARGEVLGEVVLVLPAPALYG